MYVYYNISACFVSPSTHMCDIHAVLRLDCGPLQKHLPQLEVLVDARIKRAEAENAAAKHRQHQAAAK